MTSEGVNKRNSRIISCACVIKHAEATRVIVQLISHEKSVVLSVEDDGQGVDQNNNKRGIGMHSIVARAKVIGGNLAIDSLVGRGTTVLIEVPL